jgi:hypothetical protein
MMFSRKGHPDFNIKLVQEKVQFSINWKSKVSFGTEGFFFVSYFFFCEIKLFSIKFLHFKGGLSVPVS